MIKKILTIAGSDCSGGAGIQADLKTFCAHNVYGMSVITSITSQNSKGVQRVYDVPFDEVDSQLASIFDDFIPNSIKIGMLSNIEICRTVNKYLENYKGFIIIDPVMVSTSGKRLLDEKCITYLKENIYKKATLITPNINEAEVLSGIKINTLEDIYKCYERIKNFTKSAILIKGGHFGIDSDDFLFFENKVEKIKGQRYKTKNTHGTGCTLSSSIASNLAMGLNLKEAVLKSKEYISGAIKNDLKLKEENGPLNHMFIFKNMK